ncbi:MAG TPA: K(+)-transporting ATPase subunit F [Steroidobacteraceae bacterium]|nr:K(+)-transporting ATPase subunit F [Steroidobacteraceae bacterium]
MDRESHLAPRTVSAACVVSGLLAVALCVYLLYAMLKPEKF